MQAVAPLHLLYVLVHHARVYDIHAVANISIIREHERIVLHLASPRVLVSLRSLQPQQLAQDNVTLLVLHMHRDTRA